MGDSSTNSIEDYRGLAQLHLQKYEPSEVPLENLLRVIKRFEKGENGPKESCICILTLDPVTISPLDSN